MAFATHGNTTRTIIDVGQRVYIPDNPSAHLRYYVDTICTLLDFNEESVVIQRLERPRPSLAELRDYSTTRRMTGDELKALHILSLVFSPDKLIGTFFIQDDALCGDGNNKFLSLSTLERNIAISDSTVIGGQMHSVNTIMAFKPVWIVKYWMAPIKIILKDHTVFQEKMATLKQMFPVIVFLEPLFEYKMADPPLRQTSSCCTLL